MVEVENDDDFWKKIAKIYSKVSNNREDQIIIDPEWNIIRKIVIALNGVVDILTRPLNVPNLKPSNMLYVVCIQKSTIKDTDGHKKPKGF